MQNKNDSSYKSGFVAVVGQPNVGKSTLINALIGQKIAAVSPRPQTTRKQQLGILSLVDAQIIFTDTPGLHQARHKLGALMNEQAAAALENTDAVLFVVDAQSAPN
ncbi:MAG: 50S ribosome-binding GTPase, partial [Anaerolineae bacterium]|nr:50S ribosome-binding GTPase [Anaerolineae bacterium]